MRFRGRSQNHTEIQGHAACARPLAARFLMLANQIDNEFAVAVRYRSPGRCDDHSIGDLHSVWQLTREQENPSRHKAESDVFRARNSGER